MSRIAIRTAFAALALSTVACASMTPPFRQSAPERDWASTLDVAMSLASQGRALQADSLLTRYASTYPGTPGATESYYWRSVMLVQDGAFPSPGPATLLDTYLKNPSAQHRIEATALRFTAARVDSLMRATSALSTKVMQSNGEVTSARSQAADAKADVKAVAADSKDQDAEIRRLREELAKSKEELERIKKRLAEPPKKPPR
jgi:hypothetical protein